MARGLTARTLNMWRDDLYGAIAKEAQALTAPFNFVTQ
jgi:hypothetical protein